MVKQAGRSGRGSREEEETATAAASGRATAAAAAAGNARHGVSGGAGHHMKQKGAVQQQQQQQQQQQHQSSHNTPSRNTKRDRHHHHHQRHHAPGPTAAAGAKSHARQAHPEKMIIRPVQPAIDPQHHNTPQRELHKERHAEHHVKHQHAWPRGGPATIFPPWRNNHLAAAASATHTTQAEDKAHASTALLLLSPNERRRNDTNHGTRTEASSLQHHHHQQQQLQYKRAKEIWATESNDNNGNDQCGNDKDVQQQQQPQQRTPSPATATAETTESKTEANIAVIPQINSLQLLHQLTAAERRQLARKQKKHQQKDQGAAPGQQPLSLSPQQLARRQIDKFNVHAPHTATPFGTALTVVFRLILHAQAPSEKHDCAQASTNKTNRSSTSTRKHGSKKSSKSSKEHTQNHNVCDPANLGYGQSVLSLLSGVQPVPDSDGLYSVRLFIQQKWRTITVSDEVPVDPANPATPLWPTISFSDEPNTRFLWPLLYGKALARVHGMGSTAAPPSVELMAQSLMGWIPVSSHVYLVDATRRGGWFHEVCRSRGPALRCAFAEAPHTPLQLAAPIERGKKGSSNAAGDGSNMVIDDSFVAGKWFEVSPYVPPAPAPVEEKEVASGAADDHKKARAASRSEKTGQREKKPAEQEEGSSVVPNEDLKNEPPMEEELRLNLYDLVTCESHVISFHSFAAHFDTISLLHEEARFGSRHLVADVWTDVKKPFNADPFSYIVVSPDFASALSSGQQGPVVAEANKKAVSHTAAGLSGGARSKKERRCRRNADIILVVESLAWKDDEGPSGFDICIVRYDWCNNMRSPFLSLRSTTSQAIVALKLPLPPARTDSDALIAHHHMYEVSVRSDNSCGYFLTTLSTSPNIIAGSSDDVLRKLGEMRSAVSSSPELPMTVQPFDYSSSGSYSTFELGSWQVLFQRTIFIAEGSRGGARAKSKTSKRRPGSPPRKKGSRPSSPKKKGKGSRPSSRERTSSRPSSSKRSGSAGSSSAGAGGINGSSAGNEVLSSPTIVKVALHVRDPSVEPFVHMIWMDNDTGACTPCLSNTDGFVMELIPNTNGYSLIGIMFVPDDSAHSLALPKFLSDGYRVADVADAQEERKPAERRGSRSHNRRSRKSSVSSFSPSKRRCSASQNRRAVESKELFSSGETLAAATVLPTEPARKRFCTLASSWHLKMWSSRKLASCSVAEGVGDGVVPKTVWQIPYARNTDAILFRGTLSLAAAHNMSIRVSVDDPKARIVCNLYKVDDVAVHTSEDPLLAARESLGACVFPCLFAEAKKRIYVEAKLHLSMVGDRIAQGRPLTCTIEVASGATPTLSEDRTLAQHLADTVKQWQRGSNRAKKGNASRSAYLEKVSKVQLTSIAGGDKSVSSGVLLSEEDHRRAKSVRDAQVAAAGAHMAYVRAQREALYSINVDAAVRTDEIIASWRADVAKRQETLSRDRETHRQTQLLWEAMLDNVKSITAQLAAVKPSLIDVEEQVSVRKRIRRRGSVSAGKGTSGGSNRHAKHRAGRSHHGHGAESAGSIVDFATSLEEHPVARHGSALLDAVRDIRSMVPDWKYQECVEKAIMVVKDVIVADIDVPLQVILSMDAGVAKQDSDSAALSRDDAIRLMIEDAGGSHRRHPKQRAGQGGTSSKQRPSSRPLDINAHVSERMHLLGQLHVALRFARSLLDWDKDDSRKEVAGCAIVSAAFLRGTEFLIDDSVRALNTVCHIADDRTAAGSPSADGNNARPKADATVDRAFDDMTASELGSPNSGISWDSARFAMLRVQELADADHDLDASRQESLCRVKKWLARIDASATARASRSGRSNKKR